MPMPPGPVPTLRDLHQHACWLWLDCVHCDNRRPVVIAHLMIALGVDASSAKVRSGAICLACGHRGARTQLPSHAGSDVGTAPFPYDWVAWDRRQSEALLRNKAEESNRNHGRGS